jgi:Ca-activated chloride channel family protein
MKSGDLNMAWLLMLVPILVLFLALAFRARRRAMEAFAAAPALGRLLGDVSFAKQRAKAALLVIAAALVILCLMKPQWGYHTEKVERRGVDVMVALDTSRSMLAADVQPNRLECAKRKIKDLLGVLRGDRIGLTIFAGDAFVQCPLTLDYAAFNIFLDDASVGSVPLGGTNIGRAIRKALTCFEGKGKKHKVLILITDGEDLEGDALAAAREAKERGIPVYTVGIGKRAGDYIWVANPSGERERLKDAEGNYVKSHLDEAALTQIAQETGARYTSADSSDWGLERIYQDEISAMEKRRLGSQQVRIYEHRFQWPLLLGIVLLIVEGLLDERKRKG